MYIGYLWKSYAVETDKTDSLIVQMGVSPTSYKTPYISKRSSTRRNRTKGSIGTYVNLFCSSGPVVEGYLFTVNYPPR